MKGRVFYGIAVAVSDRAVAVQDRAEIPHVKDGLLLDFRADQRARGRRTRRSSVFLSHAAAYSGRLPVCLSKQGDEQKARIRPALQPGFKFGTVEFRNFGEISGAPGPCCHGGNAMDGVQVGICFFDSKTWRFSSSNKQG